MSKTARHNAAHLQSPVHRKWLEKLIKPLLSVPFQNSHQAAPAGSLLLASIPLNHVINSLDSPTVDVQTTFYQDD